jgi:cell division septation protein DedD
MEQNKVLMVIVSVAIFLTAVIGVGVALLYPRVERGESGEIRGSVEEFDPIEYIRRPDPAPIVEEESDDDPVIIVYGSEDETEVTQPSDASETTDERLPPGDERESETAKPVVVAPRPSETTPARESTPTVTATRRTTPAPQRSEPRRERVTEYWIQLIASPNRDRVEQARLALAEYNLGGRVTTRDVSGTLYYRLRVGPYLAKAEANKFLDWIQGIEGFGNSYVSLVHAQRVVAN